MPLPWKKAKVAKISKLVADFHAPKHGGSLVVETGFPTSLIDLFVKNRDRLRKSSKRKHVKPPELHTCNSSCPAPPSSPTPMATLPPLLTEPVRASVSGDVKDPDRQVKISQPEEEVVGAVSVAGAFVEHKPCEERSVVLAAVKTFLVVVLAMSTKKLVLGITMSAFLLLFLEYVAARAARFFGPSVDADRALSCLIQSLSTKKSLLVWFGMGRCEDSTNNLAVQQDESCGLNEGIKLEDCIEEIHSEEIVVDCVEESRIGELERVSVGGDKRRECMKVVRFVEEEDKRNPVLICKTERSRCAKLTSKIVHKFVPRKLRHVRKKGKDREKETGQETSYEEPGWFVGNRLSIIEEEEEHVINGGQEKDDILHALVEEIEQERCKGEDLKLNVGAEVLGAKEKKSVVLGTNSLEYLIFLLIVLVGLLGGKVVALVLTVGWSWTLWIFGKIRKSGDAYCSLPISR